MSTRTAWRQKATSDMIMKKVNRQRKPVTSYTQLANELGAPVYPNRSGNGGPAPSGSFRQHVLATVGEIF